MDENKITWNATTEALQTVLTLLDPGTREYVLSEMKGFAEDEEVPGAAGQYELTLAISGSSHQQDGW